MDQFGSAQAFKQQNTYNEIDEEFSDAENGDN
jgi:hypothetical protein